MKKLFEVYSYIRENSSQEDELESLFQQLVPGSGKADTEEGEIVRAAMRIIYRNYNDGDEYDNGYGLETVSPSVDWLIDKTDIGYKVEQIFEKPDVDYSKKMDWLTAVVVDYVKNKEGQYSPNSSDSRNYRRSGKAYDDDYTDSSYYDNYWNQPDYEDGEE